MEHFLSLSFSLTTLTLTKNKVLLFPNRPFLILDLPDTSSWLDSGYPFPVRILYWWLCVLSGWHEMYICPSMVILISVTNQGVLWSLIFSRVTKKQFVGKLFKTMQIFWYSRFSIHYWFFPRQLFTMMVANAHFLTPTFSPLL